MNKLRRMGAVLALSFTLAVSAFAGIIHSPGAVEPPPPPPQEEESSTSSTSTTDATTMLLLTIINLIP